MMDAAAGDTSRAPSRVCAVIAAGGTGSRFGNPGGKQLVDIAGRPMLAWTIQAFDRARLVEHIVVVCPAEKADEMRKAAVEPYGFATPVTFAAAGETRQDSTRSGVAAIPGGFGYAAIHDGARPLILPETIDHAIEELIADPALDGVVCGHPAIDTLKLASADGLIEGTPERSRYWAVQTPQILSIEAFLRAYDMAVEQGFVGTDDTSLVERAGGCVRCIDSPRDNMKVTMPEDLVPVTAIMMSRLAAGDSAAGAV